MTYLSEDLYKTIVKNIPLVCVDILPVKKVNEEWRIGIITRATGPETGKPAILGGRIYYGELIKDTISRNLEADLGIKSYKFLEGHDESQPYYVQQYVHADSAKNPLGYDPTKQAVALLYLVKLDDEPQPKNEASNFYWINKTQIPKAAAYNQQVIMKFVLSKLDQNTES